MGIFEKSIPKYVVNPIDRTVEVAPQEVYVDDIFDPIFNANVRNAMRQKYGDGLYGITGGYGELLQNTWGGDKGLFGKGMGLLSAFGRSMEKADDLVLGALTETVEGLSGQGFDNPLKQIFVEDQDYTGKHLLASTANIFRNLAGGTTVTEQDLGTAWNIPALGIELGTDVGILGSGLSRKLAPAARNFTSKELFQRLGKSDVKTTVGEIGQLMSNYDDLMARVAIDVTAPGLRPAFKKLSNKLAQWVATHSPQEYVDAEILMGSPEVRKAAAEYYANEPMAQLLENTLHQTERIPNSADTIPPGPQIAGLLPFPEGVYKSGYQAAQELQDYEALEQYRYIKDILESGDNLKIDDELRKISEVRGAELTDIYNRLNAGLSAGLGELLARMQARGIPIDKIGIEQSSDDLLNAVYNNDFDALRSLVETKTPIGDLINRKNMFENEYYSTGSNQAFRNYEALDQFLSSVMRAQDSLDEVRKIVQSTASDATKINKEYASEILDKLSDDSKFIDTLRTGEWTTNDAANKTIESALGNPTYKQSLWYSSANPKYRVSPSRLTKLDELGPTGTSLARTRLEMARYFLRNSNKVRFRNVNELNNYLKSSKMEQVLKHYFPSTSNVDDIRKAILDVYYPKSNSVKDYTASLEKLSELLESSRLSEFSDNTLKYAPNESMFIEDLYKAFDDVDPLTGKMYGIDQTYLQLLRDETPSSKGARKASSSADKLHTVSEDASTSLQSYIKSALSQVAPYIKTDEDLKYFIEPIVDYIQVQPAQTIGKLDEAFEYLSRTTGIPKKDIPEALMTEHLKSGRLQPSESTLKIVNTFKSEVYSKVKAYVDRYGTYYGKKPSEASWKEYYEVRRLMGFKDNVGYLKQHGISTEPLAEGFANRLMFESLVDSKTGRLKISNLSKYRVNLMLEDTAMRANLSKKLPNPELDLNEEFTQIIDRYRKEPITSKNASAAAEATKETIANQPPETVAKQAYSTHSTASTTAEETVNKMAGEMNDFAKKGGSEAAGKTIFGERKWRWFKQISDALSVSSTNAFRSQRATLRTERAKALAKRFSDFVRRYTVTGKPEDFKRFYVLRQQLLGDSVAGKDFWTEFRRSGTMTAAYEAGSKQIPIVEAALKKNATLINEAVGKPIVEVVTKEYSAGVKTVTIRFTGDTNTVKYVKKAQKALDNAKYSDVTFSPPRALTGDERAFIDSAAMRELSGLMNELQSLSSDQAKLLGFNFDSATPYTRHAMNRSAGTAEWINRKFYDKLKSEDYDDISSLISNFDAYRKTDKGAFGTSLQGKRFRGDYWLLDDAAHSVFEYNPDKIFTSTLADGIFANLQYQDFTDLFINDNFKIKGWFNTVEDLKKVLYATDSKGRLSGNFANSELISFKLDENGKITGLVKYDKTTDAGLAKALADENTILVPANAVSHMDNVLRKDVRMNNKFWSFINKHFTIPFKFGLLSNPGFLIGNMSDSTLKLATTMCEKYGTTIEKEAANVAECINASQVLKNDYADAFKVWKDVSAEYGIRLSPEATVPEIVAMSPKYKEDFLKWLDDSLDVPYTYQNEAGIYITEYRHVPCELPKEVVENASIWTMLQGVQMNSSKLREYADLAELSPDSKFDVATNWFDRITQGSGKYDRKNFRTWGLFMNNPYMKTLTDASGGWEDIIRTASILDDLRHGQYSKEDFAKFARGSASAEDSILYRVRLDEAKNTMFNAQFDYERQSDFISKIGKSVPFPIFFLKNFAYWMELFEKNPQFVDNAIDVQEGLWAGYNEEDDKFMTEAKGRGAVPVGGKALPEWFKGVYKPSPLQSMFGAFNLLNDPVDNLTYRVNPLISGAKTAAAETLPDSDLTTLLQDSEGVKYRPYSTDMYERNIKQGDPNFNSLEYTLHRMNPYERAINTYLRVPEKVKKEEAQLSDVLPSVFQPMF